jgi:plastocyanin domain-containing protein
MNNKTSAILLCLLLVGQVTFALSQVRDHTKKRGHTNKVKVIEINLTQKGFEPENIRLKVGQPTKLRFTRKVSGTCATEVIIPGYNIKRDLPFNTPVNIELTPKNTGTLSFSCGMRMIKGSLVVQ